MGMRTVVACAFLSNVIASCLRVFNHEVLAPSLRLRGGSGDIYPPAKGRQDIAGMTSKEIWEKVYMAPGFSNVCGDTFEHQTIGKNLEADMEGRRVKNIVYGASSARTERVMRYGDRIKMHYLEAVLVGGGPPIEGWKGFEFDGQWYAAEDICGDGTIAATIGIVAGGALKCFDNSTMPDDCLIYKSSGCLRWPWRYNEWQDIDDEAEDPRTALSDLIPSQQKDENAICSGDRVGVLVDFFTNKVAFFRNGELVPEYSRSLARLVPPLVLRFMVGGQRPNTTWTMCSREEGIRTLEQLDWKEWVTDLNPNCVDWRPLHGVEQTCTPEEVESFKSFIADYLKEVRNSPPPPGELA